MVCHVTSFAYKQKWEQRGYLTQISLSVCLLAMAKAYLNHLKQEYWIENLDVFGPTCSNFARW